MTLLMWEQQEDNRDTLSEFLRFRIFLFLYSGEIETETIEIKKWKERKTSS